MVFQNPDWERRRRSEREWDEDYEERYAGYDPSRRRYWSEPGRAGRRDYGREYEPATSYDEDWWRKPGPHVGVGPRGYRRSDESILEDVFDRMESHGALDASEITIGVQDGIVTLTGFADSRQAKRLAEDIAFSISGVVDVDNHLQVFGLHAARRRRGLNEYAGGYGSGYEAGFVTEPRDRTRTEYRDEFETGRRGRAGYENITPGMQVFGSDGQFIGNVKGVRKEDFLVDIPLARDVYVPFDAASIRGPEEIFLDVPTDEIGNQGWEQPPLIGSAETEEETRADQP